MKLLLPLAVLFFAFSFCSSKFTEYFGVRKSTTSTPEIVSNSTVSPTPSAKPTTEKLDDDELLSKLLEVEEDWKSAQIKGDRAILERIFAEEFVNIDGDGKKYNKKEWIKATGGGYAGLKTCKFTEAQIDSNAGDTAVMSVIKTFIYDDGQTQKTRDVDKFVLRDGNWQVASSQSTIIK